MRTIVLEKFEAVGENEKKYNLTVYQKMIDASSMDNPNAEIPGMKSILTDEGYHVNYVNDTTFMIVEIGEKITRCE